MLTRRLPVRRFCLIFRMEIFSAEQIRAWDEYTKQHEPIASIDLMERAAASCLSWLEKADYLGHSFSIYCGKGNNGGDGLALARLLSSLDCAVTVHILRSGLAYRLATLGLANRDEGLFPWSFNRQ